MQQEVVLAMLAKEPSHGYQLRARLRDALGPLGDAMNAGQIYVTLTRLEKAGLLAVERSLPMAPTGRIARCTRSPPTANERVAEWIAEVSWPKPDLAEFHLKLTAAAAAGLADPLTLRGTPSAASCCAGCATLNAPPWAEPEGSDAALLLEGVVLRLQADLRWLEACEQSWDRPKEQIVSDIADTSVLRARGLRKHYGRGEGLVRAVDGVDLDIGAGETVAAMGPGGCGKSTLLHLLGGLDRPSGGEVSLNGRRIDDLGEKALARMRRTDVGFVFQAFHLMEELTAIENVELPALLAGSSPRAARRRAADLLGRRGWPTGRASCPRPCRAASGSGSR